MQCVLLVLFAGEFVVPFLFGPLPLLEYQDNGDSDNYKQRGRNGDTNNKYNVAGA